MDALISIIALFFIICFGLMIYIFGYRSEKKEWNYGECNLCNGKWTLFGRDSQGGRGYSCGCNRYIWISYPIDR